jgi:hypothetical protein
LTYDPETTTSHPAKKSSPDTSGMPNATESTTTLPGTPSNNAMSDDSADSTSTTASRTS